MNNCSCCGSSIPDGQRVCSMCYGDVDYGNDGYYRHQLEMEEIEKQRDVEIEEEWHPPSLDQIVELLSKKYKLISSGDAFGIMALIDFYLKHKGDKDEKEN